MRGLCCRSRISRPRIQAHIRSSPSTPRSADSPVWRESLVAVRRKVHARCERHRVARSVGGRRSSLSADRLFSGAVIRKRARTRRRASACVCACVYVCARERVGSRGRKSRVDERRRESKRTRKNARRAVILADLYRFEKDLSESKKKKRPSRIEQWRSSDMSLRDIRAYDKYNG